VAVADTTPRSHARAVSYVYWLENCSRSIPIVVASLMPLVPRSYWALAAGVNTNETRMTRTVERKSENDPIFMVSVDFRWFLFVRFFRFYKWLFLFPSGCPSPGGSFRDYLSVIKN
jgi:hypothetical protein